MSSPLSNRARRLYSEAEKVKLIEEFFQSGLTMNAFTTSKGMSITTLSTWLNERGLRKEVANKSGPRSSDERRQAVEAYHASGLTMRNFAKTWGVGQGTLSKWIRAYEQLGPKGLENESFCENAEKRGPKGISERLKEEIKNIKLQNSELGLKKIKDILARFKGIKVSPGTIRKTLVESDIPLVKTVKKRRRGADQIRHFERAKAMQLWQSDITSYVLTRHGQRVYLTVFMDDHSRYVVAWSLELRQTGEFVLAALLNGIQKFGKPEEVLTDQGRQYFTWRGKGEFQKRLDKEGIKHVVSRSHHPQTLGKCERFWETVSKEFWTRAKPQDLKDAQSRFEHFVNHYNHFRPHQGLDGMVPADRFFGVENEVRKILEETMEKNAIRLAVDEAPRTPVFLIGQIGDKPLSLHGESGKLVLQTPTSIDEINYEHFGHKKTILGDNYERVNDYKKEAGSKERLCDTTETGITSEGNLASFDSRGEEQGPPNWNSNNGILGGENNERGSSEEIKHSDDSYVATVTNSSIGNVSWTPRTTEDETQRGNDEQGRRSEIFNEENCGTGEDDSDAGSID